MHAIGIMQGRLVPKLDGRVQAFPRDTWEAEFPLAREVGFASIELTIDMASWDMHPVRSAEGRRRLAGLAGDHGIGLVGLCCDVFMERPLVGDDSAAAQEARAMLDTLIRDGGQLGLPFLELPMVGRNAIRDAAAQDRFAAILETALPLAERSGLDLLLETDLDAAPLAALMARHEHPRLGLNYDSGNSTWFGFDPDQELPAYHRFIRNVHIKDCTRADYSVPLGTGETRFDRVFARLAEFGYRGDFILQAARQDDDVGAARDYLAFTRRCVETYL